MEYKISCNSNLKTEIKLNFSDNNCYTITLEQLIKIINNNNKWKFNNLECEYHFYYGNNRKKVSLLEFLYDNYKNTNMYINFQNNNKYDFTSDNISIYHHKHLDITKEYNVIEYIPGYITTNGKESGYMKNPLWKINDNNEIYYIMYCEKDKIIKLCDNSLNKIRNYENENNEKLIFYYGKKWNQCLSSSHIYKKINLKNLIMGKIDDYSMDIYYKNNNIYDFRFNNLYLQKKDKPLNNNTNEINNDIDTNLNNQSNDTFDYINSLYTVQTEYLKNQYNYIDLYSWSNLGQRKNGTTITNPIWKYIENHKYFYIMYCGKDIYTKLCKTSLDKIRDFEKNYNNNKHITFYVCENGYIQSNTITGIKKKLYMHQIIMNLYGQGKGTMNESVDHINKDVTDNRYINLRIGDRKIQENNKERTGRKKSKLPEGFIPENFPKYFEYNCEKLPSGTIREFFRIPKRNTPLEKNWTSSKSVKISILEKYRDGLNKYKQVFGELPSDITYPDNFIL